jgi:hypothetical protein
MHFPFHLHQQIRKEAEEKAKRLESISKKESIKEKEKEKKSDIYEKNTFDMILILYKVVTN